MPAAMPRSELFGSFVTSFSFSSSTFEQESGKGYIEDLKAIPVLVELVPGSLVSVFTGSFSFSFNASSKDMTQIRKIFIDF
jgi:hypothetical protein